MDLSIAPKSRLGEYGSAGSFAACPFAVPANAKIASKASATTAGRCEPAGNIFKLEILLICFLSIVPSEANRTRSYPSGDHPFFQPEKLSDKLLTKKC
jgi:hypothetical protein